MTQFLASPAASLLFTIILATLAIGLPILVVLAIRFFWDRNVHIARSKELEKLIWQLHRIASAMEHQLNLSFPAVQPGTEDARDRAFLTQPASQPAAAVPSTAPRQAGTLQSSAQPQPAPQQTPPGPQQPSADTPRQAGVNSMFGFER
jgi:uncharacterized membrane protein